MENNDWYMIVVHPSDPSTAMLKSIYEGLDGVRLFDSFRQRNEIAEALASAPKEEAVLLLGHGCPSGLLDMRYGLIVGEKAVPSLKNRENLIGIWCFASTFAERHHLKGFFSGMFISEPAEAYINGVEASPEEIYGKAVDFSRRLGDLLRAGVPLKEAALEMSDPKHIDSELTKFNYSRLTYRETGNEDLPVEEFDW